MALSGDLQRVGRMALRVGAGGAEDAPEEQVGHLPLVRDMQRAGENPQCVVDTVGCVLRQEQDASGGQ